MAAAKQGAASTATGGGDDPAAAHRPLSLAAGIPLSIGGVALVAGATGMLPGRPGAIVTKKIGATRGIRDSVKHRVAAKIAAQIETDAEARVNSETSDQFSQNTRWGLGVDAFLTPLEYEKLVVDQQKKLEPILLEKKKVQETNFEGELNSDQHRVHQQKRAEALHQLDNYRNEFLVQLGDAVAERIML